MRWEREPNGEAVDASGPIQPGLRYYGVLTSTDDRNNDYFYFDLSAAGTVVLWLTNMAPEQDFNLMLRDASRQMQGYLATRATLTSTSSLRRFLPGATTCR